jgi:hypothetical protein
VSEAPANKPAAKPKPPKPEDKPFPEFIDTLFLPAVAKQLLENGITADRLERIDGDRPVVGGNCPMVVGDLPGGRRFWLCFAKEDINSGKVIALADPGSDPTLLESFLIDEKRMSLALTRIPSFTAVKRPEMVGGELSSKPCPPLMRIPT